MTIGLLVCSPPLLVKQNFTGFRVALMKMSHVIPDSFGKYFPQISQLPLTLGVEDLPPLRHPWSLRI